MKKLMTLIVSTALLSGYSFPQDHYQKFKVSNDIEVVKITDDAYVHISYATLPQYGRIGANGLILINDGKAALFDTPWTDSLTKELVDWIKNILKAKVVEFVPNHWHQDCMGGLGYLNSLGVKSYANEMTIQIAKTKNLPLPANGFKDSLTLSLGSKKIICNYLGAAHALDNIVVWIPSEKILFAGCMAKEFNSTNLGNTVDGDLKEYPNTIKKVMKKYPDAKFVIPGHGQFGGIELLQHTLDLAQRTEK